MTLLWLPEALEDVERLFAFLLEKDAAAADRAVRLISSSGGSLQVRAERLPRQRIEERLEGLAAKLDEAKAHRGL